MLLFTSVGRCSALAAIFFVLTSHAAADWPTFRGASRTAVSQETNLLQQWPEDGPPLAWSAKGAGRGYASLAVADGKILTLGDGPSTADDDDEYLICFDQQDGSQLWMTKTGPAWNRGQSSWQSSRSTPTVDGNRVYVITPHGELICCETDKGAELWRKHLRDDLGGKKADSWGYSESVLVDGGRVVCTPGGENATMAALDKATGETIWTSAREGDRGAGHSSIVISNVGGTKVYVQTTGSGAFGVRASDGKLLWSYPIDRTTAVIPTPIIRDDLVFFAAGYGRGGALLRQVSTDEGIDVKEVYPLNPKLANKHGGVVALDGCLYADTDSSGILYCADFMTGEVLWKERGPGRGSISLAAADDRLYMHFSNGVMALAKVGPETYEEVGTFRVPETGDRPSWAHPVISDGKLYLREQDTILCYDIRQK